MFCVGLCNTDEKVWAKRRNWFLVPWVSTSLGILMYAKDKVLRVCQDLYHTWEMLQVILAYFHRQEIEGFIS